MSRSYFTKNLLFQEYQHRKLQFMHLNMQLEQNTLITTAYFLYALWLKKNYISASIILLMQTELHTSDRLVLLVAHKWKGEMKQIQIIGSSTSDFTGFNWDSSYFTQVFILKKWYISSHAFCLLSTFLRSL